MKRLVLLRRALILGLCTLLGTFTQGQTVKGLQRQLSIAQHDTTRLRLYADLVAYFYHNDQYDSLFLYNQKLFDLANKAHSRNYLGEYYYRLGLYYRGKGLFEQSLAALQKAIPLYQQVNNTSRIADMRYALTVVYADKGDPKRVISQSLANLTYFEEYHFTDQILATYTVLASTYHNQHNSRQKLFYIDKYLQLVKATRDLEAIYLGYDLKASFYEDQGLYRQGWPYRRQQLQTARRRQKADPIIDALIAVGKNLRGQKRSATAMPYLREAMQLGRAVSEPFLLSYLWQELALNELQLGHQQAAVRAAKLGLSTAYSGKRPTYIIDASKTLATVQETVGAYRSALQTYKAYKTLEDSLLSLEKAKAIAQTQTRYDLTRKENTIQLLHKNAQFQRLKAKAQEQQLALASQQRLILLAGISSLLVLLALVSYFLRKARITHQQLIQQNEQIENQANQLQAVNTQLTDANQLKDKLFSIVGHDLRSPVASIKATLSLLSAQKRQTRELAALEQEVNNLAHTLDNVLYWSLNQQKGLRVRLQRVALTELVSDGLEGLQGLIQAKKLIIHLLPSPVEQCVDEDLTLLVIRNVLHNAIKFTPPGGAIRISIRQEPLTTHLIISDTGPGMAVQHAPELVRNRLHGTGLGLILSRELMKRNGGRLDLESYPDKGTTVTLSWPTIPVPAIDNRPSPGPVTSNIIDSETSTQRIDGPE